MSSLDRDISTLRHNTVTLHEKNWVPVVHPLPSSPFHVSRLQKTSPPRSNTPPNTQTQERKHAISVPPGRRVFAPNSVITAASTSDPGQVPGQATQDNCGLHWRWPSTRTSGSEPVLPAARGPKSLAPQADATATQLSQPKWGVARQHTLGVVSLISETHSS